MFSHRIAPIRMALRPVSAAVLTAALLAPAAGVVVASDAEGPLTVYSGRSLSLVGPVLEQFTEATGIEVETKYADTAELAALLFEEGQRSPADVFFAQDAGALGAVADAGLFAQLDEATLERVAPGFRDADGFWVGISGRARTAAYTTLKDIELPDSILDFTAPEWSGRIGWVPANGSFQSFVTALRVIEGEDATRAWLEGIIANDPVVYPKNSAAVEGVAAGEVDVAFVNHYYLLELMAENGPDYPVAQKFFDGGDPGSLINVAGIGRLASTDQPDAATALVEFLLGEQAQTYFADETYEYPLIAGVSADPRLPALDTIEAPQVDLNDLADLQGHGRTASASRGHRLGGCVCSTSDGKRYSTARPSSPTGLAVRTSTDRPPGGRAVRRPARCSSTRIPRGTCPRRWPRRSPAAATCEDTRTRSLDARAGDRGRYRGHRVRRTARLADGAQRSARPAYLVGPDDRAAGDTLVLACLRVRRGLRAAGLAGRA